MKSQKIPKQTMDMVDKNTGEIKNLPIIKHQLTARYYPKDYEVNTHPSEARPGQSMTIKEMVERHRRGLPLTESKGALYQGEELFPDLSQMDEIDKAAYMDSVADALVDLRAKIDLEAKTKQEKDLVAKIDELARKKFEEMRLEEEKKKQSNS